MTEEISEKAKKTRKGLDKVLSAFLLVLMVALVVDVTWQVVSRYLLKEPSSFTDELARFLLIWLGMIGAAYGLGQRVHLAIDLIMLNKSARFQRNLRRFIHFLIFIFSASVLIYGGGGLVETTFVLEQTSSALGVNLGWVYLAIPLSGVLTCVYAVLNFINPQIKFFEPSKVNA
jgi:TRAP-type C4-dicarboxylate transport system permease small subunit